MTVSLSVCVRAIAYACLLRRCIYGREPGWPVDEGSSSVDLGDATSAAEGFDSGAVERACRLLKDLAVVKTLILAVVLL
jgi:hypothetical protein